MYPVLLHLHCHMVVYIQANGYNVKENLQIWSRLYMDGKLGKKYIFAMYRGEKKHLSIILFENGTQMYITAQNILIITFSRQILLQKNM